LVIYILSNQTNHNQSISLDDFEHPVLPLLYDNKMTSGAARQDTNDVEVNLFLDLSESHGYSNADITRYPAPQFFGESSDAYKSRVGFYQIIFEYLSLCPGNINIEIGVNGIRVFDAVISRSGLQHLCRQLKDSFRVTWNGLTYNDEVEILAHNVCRFLPVSYGGNKKIQAKDLQKTKSQLKKMVKRVDDVQLMKSALSKEAHHKQKQNPPANKKINDSIMAFAHARLCAASPQAIGCRVPDPYPYPTLTAHIKTTLVLGSDSSGSGGLYCFPSPLITFFDAGAMKLIPSLVGTGTIGSAGGCYNIGSNMFAMSSPGEIFQYAASYRVVSSGFTLRNLQPQLSAAGRVYIAQVPMSNVSLNFAAIAADSITNYANLASLVTSIPSIGPQIQEFPTALPPVSIATDLTKGDININPIIYDAPLFYSFKTTLTGAVGLNGTTLVADSVIMTTAGVTSSTLSGLSDAYNMVGGSAVLLYYEGVPASATTLLELDVNFHLEFVPPVVEIVSTNTNGLIPVASSATSSVTGTTHQVELINNAANSKPYDFFEIAEEFVGSLSDRVLGKKLTKNFGGGKGLVGMGLKLAGSVFGM
jgi:hypothetical protein